MDQINITLSKENQKRLISSIEKTIEILIDAYEVGFGIRETLDKEIEAYKNLRYVIEYGGTKEYEKAMEYAQRKFR